MGRDHQVAKRALVFWSVGALVVAIAIVARVAAIVLLLTFAGVLFGTSLRAVAEWLAHHARMPVAWSVALCIVVSAVLVFAAGELVVPPLAAQLPALWNGIVGGWHALEAWLATSTLGRQLLDETGQAGAWLEQHAAVAFGVVTGVTGAIGAIAYVIFVACYYAAAPEVYRRGVIALVPPGSRARAHEVLDQLGTMLRRWLWARVVTMTVLGVATSIGLAIAGIPLAITLGLLAGASLFIPYLGAIASAVPGLLVAATIGPGHLAFAAVLYVVIHSADGYLLSPLLQKRAIDTPPVLVLAAQLVFGALWGIVGFTFATPLVGALLVLVRMLYVDGVLAGHRDCSASEARRDYPWLTPDPQSPRHGRAGSHSLPASGSSSPRSSGRTRRPRRPTPGSSAF